MESKDNKYFIYSHIRNDKNEIFYIGLGTKRLNRKNHKGIYYRAYEDRSYNKIWKRIINKTSYKIEILQEFDNYEEAINKEIELISFYKRKKDGGILSNITLGGEGTLGITRIVNSKGKEERRKRMLGNKINLGRILSKEEKQKISESHKGKKLSEEHKKKLTGRPKGIPAHNRKKVVNLDTGYVYNSVSEAYESNIFNFCFRTFTTKLKNNNFNFAYVR